MTDATKVLIRAGEHQDGYYGSHPMNDASEVYFRPLSQLAGLERVVLRHVRVPPGKESLIYHSHQHEEEFLYILAGRGIAEIDDEEYEIGPGDFMGFPTPSVGHNLRNPFDEDLVYLVGGESREFEVADFPRERKRIFRSTGHTWVVDYAAIKELGS